MDAVAPVAFASSWMLETIGCRPRSIGVMATDSTSSASLAPSVRHSSMSYLNEIHYLRLTKQSPTSHPYESRGRFSTDGRG